MGTYRDLLLLELKYFENSAAESWFSCEIVSGMDSPSVKASYFPESIASMSESNVAGSLYGEKICMQAKKSLLAIWEFGFRRRR